MRQFSLLMLVLCACKIAEAHNNDVTSAIEQGVPFQLAVTTNKKVYLVGEPVILNIRLYNPRHLEGSFFSLGGDLFLSVTDETGKQIPLYGTYGEGRDGRVCFGLDLKSSDNYIETNVEFIYGDVVSVSSVFQRGSFVSLINGKRRVSKYSLSAGKYIAKVTQSIFISTINSKHQFKQIHASVPFDVKEPDTREQDALELFKERPLFRDDIESSQTLSQIDIDRQQRVSSNWRNSEENYKNVYTLYPDTPYALYALYYCGRLAQESGRLEQACDSYRRVLYESPDFPLRTDLLYFLADCSLHLRQKDMARKYFNLIQIPSTKVLVSPTITYFDKLPRMAALERVLATP